MEHINGIKKQYVWGSDIATQGYFGIGEPDETLAEAQLGAYRLSPSVLPPDESTDPISLADWISADPEGTLGASVVERSGARLSYLIELTTSKRSLPLQVHSD